MLEGVRVEGFAEQKALDLVDAPGAEAVQFAGGFDALGKGREAKVLALFVNDLDTSVAQAAP